MPPFPIAESRPIPPSPSHAAPPGSDFPHAPSDPYIAHKQRVQAAVTHGSIPPEPGSVPGNHAA